MSATLGRNRRSNEGDVAAAASVVALAKSELISQRRSYATEAPEREPKWSPVPATSHVSSPDSASERASVRRGDSLDEPGAASNIIMFVLSVESGPGRIEAVEQEVERRQQQHHQ